MRKSGRVEAEGEDIVWKSKGKRGERKGDGRWVRMGGK